MKTPYDWQEEAIDLLFNKRSLLVKAPPGSGKTMIGQMAIEDLGSGATVLVVVHSKDLMRQWIREGVDAVTIQSLMSQPDHYRVDLLILDEVHHFESPIWSAVYDMFDYDYILGLSATPGEAKRRFAEVYEVKWDAVDLPEYEFVYHKFKLESPAKTEYDKLTKEIINVSNADDLDDAERDKIVLNLSMQRRRVVHNSENRHIHLVNTIPEILGDHTLIVCETIDQAERLGEELDIPTYHSRNKDVDTLDAFRNQEIPAIISVKMLKEGFNCPAIDTVIVASSALTETHVVQVLGRGLRLYPDKEVTFHLFIAENTSDERLVGLAEGIMEGKEDTTESLEYKWKRGKQYSIDHRGMVFQTLADHREYFAPLGIEKEIMKLKRGGGRFRIYDDEDVLVKVGKKLYHIGSTGGKIKVSPLVRAIAKKTFLDMFKV